MGEDDTKAVVADICPPPPKPKLGRYFAAGFYACLLVAIASFGAGRSVDVIALILQARHNYFAALNATREAYFHALRIDATHPAPNPAIPHRIAFYPPLAERLNQQGTVVLKVLVLENGTVGDVEIARSSGYQQLDAAALVEVGAWAYIPAARDHHPIAAWTLVAINFRLSPSP